MQVLVVGGAGYVAGLILPALTQHHEVRILDLRPADPRYPQVLGDVNDHDTLATAMRGMDAVLHCAMGPEDVSTSDGVAKSFDVNVKSAYLTLAAAHAAGVTHAVHISSMSVYRSLTERELDESIPADAIEAYGLTKRLGEEACRAAARSWGMSVNVLRLTWPTPDEQWPRWAPPGLEPILWRRADGTPLHATAASDLADAVLRSLEYRKGFQVFTITGDTSGRLWSVAKANRLLGWQPHRTGEATTDG